MLSVDGRSQNLSFPFSAPTTAVRPASTGFSDQELIQGLTSGAEAGFAAFYQRFAATLFSLTHQILRDQKDAEDSLQDAFVKMWKKASTFDPARGTLFTWSVMIARSSALDRLRQLQRHRRNTESIIADHHVSVLQRDSLSEDRVTQREERLCMRAALSLLSVHQREALELAFFSGMTQTEIAGWLGVPLGTVKARIRRGLIGLRNVMN